MPTDKLLQPQGMCEECIVVVVVCVCVCGGGGRGRGELACWEYMISQLTLRYQFLGKREELLMKH